MTYPDLSAPRRTVPFAISTGRKVYCVQTRGPAGPKRATLGRHGEMFPNQTRRQAVPAIDRIKRGEEPMPAAPAPELTVTGLAERFLRSHVEVNCRANTKDSFGRIVRNHILPAPGGLAVSTVERRHVVALHDRLSGMSTQANRTLAVLSAMFKLAEAWDLAPPGRNPCRGVRRYRETPRERFLLRAEYRRLGPVLAEAERDGSENPAAIAAVRLLLLLFGAQIGRRSAWQHIVFIELGGVKNRGRTTDGADTP